MKIIERIKAFFSTKKSSKPNPREALKNSFGTPAPEPAITEVGVNADGKHYQATTRHVWVDGKWTARTTESRVPKPSPAPYTASTRRDAYNDSYDDAALPAALSFAMSSINHSPPLHTFTPESTIAPCPAPETEHRSSSSSYCVAPSPSYEISHTSDSNIYSSSSESSYSSSSSWD